MKSLCTWTRFLVYTREHTKFRPLHNVYYVYNKMHYIKKKRPFAIERPFAIFIFETYLWVFHSTITEELVQDRLFINCNYTFFCTHGDARCRRYPIMLVGIGKIF